MNLRALRDELERTALELALAKAGGSPRARRGCSARSAAALDDPGGTVRAMMRRYGV